MTTSRPCSARGRRGIASASATSSAAEAFAKFPVEARAPVARADELRAPAVGHDERPRRLPRRRARRLVRGRAAECARASSATTASRGRGRTEDKADDTVWAVTCVFAAPDSGVEASRRWCGPRSTTLANAAPVRSRGTRCSRRRARRSAGTRSTSAAASSSPPRGSPRAASDPSPGRHAHRLLTARLPRTGVRSGCDLVREP